MASTDQTELMETLAAAIHGQRLGQTCVDLLAEHGDQSDVVQAGLDACQTIATETDAVAARFIARLAEVGFSASASQAEGTFPQYHHFTLRIPPDGLAAALRLAADDGFAVDEFLHDRVTALRRCSGALQLMAWGDFPVRMNLRWREPGRWSRLVARFGPAPADFAICLLPDVLSYGYFVVKPLRKLVEKITGQRTADRLGLRAGSFSLGTPAALIPPLFDMLAIGPEDVVCDIGCGDGRVVIEAARRHDCRAIGVERNVALAKAAQAAADGQGLSDRVEIICGDEQAIDFATVSVVFLFLPVDLLPAMIARIRAAARPGTRIVAHEQVAIDTGREPAARLPIIEQNAMTVAHVWQT